MHLQYYIDIHKFSLNKKNTIKKTNYQVTPFRNYNNFLDSTRSLSDGHWSAIIDASLFCLMRLIDEAGRRTFQEHIFMFLASDFNIPYSLTYVWLLARTCTFVSHTWRMGITTFQFKQLLSFLSNPLNTNIVLIVNVFMKRLESSSF